MEFLQFMKCYWDMNIGEGGGSAVEDGLKENNQPAAPAEKPAVAKRATAKETKEVVSGGARRIGSGAGYASKSGSGAAPPSPSPAVVEEHQREVTELKLAVENLERERDFYYAKLREVEVMCQNKESQGEEQCTVAEVLAILYKMDEAEEFEAPAN
mmetsp:Transcript_24308/g.74225  ORF Transcript_24308/g.74225 Transcript_24308/m.74225 type:complete len:156 (+) Transcript_24308:590-1057(+)